MLRLERSPAQDTTTEDFLIFVTNGAQPLLPPPLLTKSGVKGPLGGPSGADAAGRPQQGGATQAGYIKGEKGARARRGRWALLGDERHTPIARCGGREAM